MSAAWESALRRARTTNAVNATRRRRAMQQNTEQLVHGRSPEWWADLSLKRALARASRMLEAGDYEGAKAHVLQALVTSDSWRDGTHPALHRPSG